MKTEPTKRIRIFAGPNGSGKSSIYRSIAQAYRTGPFVNADLIKQELRQTRAVDLAGFDIAPPDSAIQSFLSSSTLA